MATYNITKSDGNPGPAIADAASPDTQTDLQLVGQNAVSYGLDVATSFYWLLENFASTTAPTTGSAGRATGQLWYDITTSNETLNVYNGATWDQIANINRGSSAVTSTLRWDNAANKWSEDVRVTIDGSGILGIVGPNPGNSVTFEHDDTDFNIVGTSTVDINVTGVTAVNLPSLTLVTELDETYGGTGLTSYVAGDILYASGVNTLAKLPIGANGEVLKLSGGLPTWDSAGGLGTVTSSGAPLITEVAVFSTGTNILSDATFTWDGSTMFATNVTGTNIGGIASANLVDRASPGTLAATIFSGNITAQANILLGDDDKITLGTGGDVSIDFDSPDLDIRAVTATDINIAGFTGNMNVDMPLYVDSSGSGIANIRSIGHTTSWNTSDSYMSFYDSDMGTHGLQIGTTVASSSASIINSRSGDLELYGSNTLVLDLRSTTSTMYQAGSSAMQWRSSPNTNITTSASVYDAGGQPRNVGFNETPSSTISTARTIDADDIGKFLTRTGSTARIVTLDLNTNIPIGGSLVVHNGNSSNTLTIVEGTITDLEWIDGSGSAPSTGTRTIAYNSVVTLRKSTSANWQIWGNGIS
jgi:hypothetical protein